MSGLNSTFWRPPDNTRRRRLALRRRPGRRQRSAGSTRLSRFTAVTWRRRNRPLQTLNNGGLREGPESTERAFRRALDAGSDVLEIDVRLTKDGTYVVWHGTELDNVKVREIPDSVLSRTTSQNTITKHQWKDLEGRSWVADPDNAEEQAGFLSHLGRSLLLLLPQAIRRWIGFPAANLSQVPEDSDRSLLSLEQLLALVPRVALNIEVKGSPGPAKLMELRDMLESHGEGRQVVLAFSSPFLLGRFRRLDRALPTSFSAIGSVLFKIPGILRLAAFAVDFDRRAFQTSHRFLRRGTVRRLHRFGVPVHVFITPVLFLRGLDESPNSPSREILFKILRLDVDGIMTDRPSHIRRLIAEWQEQGSRRGSIREAAKPSSNDA